MILHVNTRSEGLEPAGNHRPAPPSPQRHGRPGGSRPVRSDQRSLFPNGPGATDLYRCSPGTARTAAPDGWRIASQGPSARTYSA